MGTVARGGGRLIAVLVAGLGLMPAGAGAGGPAAFPPRPTPCPQRWLGLLGKYGRAGSDSADFLVREEAGRLQFFGKVSMDLREAGRDTFLRDGPGGKEKAVFTRDSLGGGSCCMIGDRQYPRKFYPGERGGTPQPASNLPLDSLWAEARKARPPSEKGRFAKPELVEVRSLDPGIRLSQAYSRPGNSYGFLLYDKDAAFLQRPAARALARANASLKKMGFALKLSDAYRPWHVTKFIHMAAPVSQRQFYANPAKGSHHNRGTAVDATLVHLATGMEADMGYGDDELSDRSASDYPGGTSLQRWHRAVLRAALEGQGFRNLRKEWWHFRFISRKRYHIMNRPLSRAGGN